MKLPVLTLKQPWAGLVVLGKKTVENRSWRPKLPLPYRLLIHAGQSTDRDWEEEWYPACHRRGILGVVKVIGYVAQDDTLIGAVPIHYNKAGLGSIPKEDLAWLSPAEEDCGWVLRQPFAFDEPIPAKGKLGIWYADVDVDGLAAGSAGG